MKARRVGATLLLVCTAWTPAAAAPINDAHSTRAQLVVLATFDLHVDPASPVLAELSGKITRLHAAHPDAILVDAGDSFESATLTKQ